MHSKLNRLPQYLRCIFFGLLAGLWSQAASAQFVNTSNSNTSSATDSAGKKSNTDEWDEQAAQIYKTKAFSQVKESLDTSIHTLHRRPYSQTWYRDLGNLGSPSMNQQFSPQNPVGLSLGYHSFDALRFNVDSLSYYNTTKPYSMFTYNLGGKLEQRAEIFHTQNIKPYWNVALNYRKINSPGYYFVQRNNHDNFYLSTNYSSPGQHYQIYAVMAYNKEQHDENGGIAADSFLSNDQYSDRKTVPINFYNSGYSTKRSPVSNLQRDLTFQINQAYTWGRVDTTYNEDSTQFSTNLIPRFRLSHRLEIGSQRYLFKDMRPDSNRYKDFFAYSFASGDSVYMRQEWFYVDNRFLINGIVGKQNNQLVFNAGVGNRFDQFSTQYIVGEQQDRVVSNYLIGSILKEGTGDRQWDLSAQAQFFVTGTATGNFLVDARIAKDLGRDWARVKIGASQQLNNAPYKYTIYQNQYWSRQNSFNKEGATKIYAEIDNAKYQLSLGLRNYILTNYLYFNESQLPSQAASAFSITQVWLRKLFTFGRYSLDNEWLYQEPTSGAPVNVPRFLGRHQLAVESFIFKHQLQIASGIQLRYSSNYTPSGYAPLFNQFYYQSSYQVNKQVVVAAFFNFKIKRFRAYLMMDQLQRFFGNNLIITKGYAAQDAMIRFGFNWALIN